MLPTVGDVRGVVPGRSLRVRVTVVAALVVAVALLVAGVAVEVVLAGQLRRDQASRLDDRLARATLLLRAGTPGAALPAAVGGQGVRAVLVDAAGNVVVSDDGDGERPGRGPDAPDTPAGLEGPGVDVRPDPGPGGPGGPDGRGPGPGGRGPGPEAHDLVRELATGDGGRLLLLVDPGENARVLAQLRVVLLVVGGAALVVIVVALLIGVRGALRPLEEMAALARDIAGGDRGRRLHPRRTDTEIGRTAGAFDAMLDELESAQARAESAADEARRSEATTRRFLSDAAHELRTPITSVQSLAETLVRHPDTELERRERIATTLVRETRRAGALVGDMLELARVEGGAEAASLSPRDVDVAELAAAEAERLALTASASRVRLVADSERPAVARADPARVTQILANLLDNARRHGRAEEPTTVTTGHDADGSVRVVVADRGPGIPAEDRERVFDRLVRLDDGRGRDPGDRGPGADRGGAGLGLTIARALARAHGGDLVAEDPGPEGGARFRLTLPAAR